MFGRLGRVRFLLCRLKTLFETCSLDRSAALTPAHAAAIERLLNEVPVRCAASVIGRTTGRTTGVVRGGPNGALGLEAARAKYTNEGGKPRTHVPPAAPV